MLKLIGLGLILLASTSTGFYFAFRLRERCKQLGELQRILQVLETEIYYGSTPLSDAFKRMGRQSEGVIGRLFSRCAYYLDHTDGWTTYACFKQAVRDVEHQLALKNGDMAWLNHFGKVIGGSDRKDQHKHIRLMMTHLAQAEKEAQQDLYKQEKMYKTLGVLAGLLIVILML
jgi:stage III sporulation protein AB